MREYYVFDVTRKQTSRFDGQPFYELDIVGVDPADRLLKHYTTYVVTTYKNYRNWLPILNARQFGITVWFSGDMVFKQYEHNMIDADSKTQYLGAIPYDRLIAFFNHNIALGNIKTGIQEKEMSDIGKQFFQV